MVLLSLVSQRRGATERSQRGILLLQHHKRETEVHVQMHISRVLHEPLAKLLDSMRVLLQAYKRTTQTQIQLAKVVVRLKAPQHILVHLNGLGEPVVFQMILRHDNALTEAVVLRLMLVRVGR